MERWTKTKYKTTDKRHGVEKHVGKAELRSSWGLGEMPKPHGAGGGLEEEERACCGGGGPPGSRPICPTILQLRTLS